MRRFIVLVTLLFSTSSYGQDIPTSYPDEPQCAVKSVQKLSTDYQGMSKSPTSSTVIVNKLDDSGVEQLYAASAGALTCISCSQVPNGPNPTRNKLMGSWHPSGQWLAVGVEEDIYDWSWLPQQWKRGFLQSGIWLDMWVMTPDGSHWYRLADFKSLPGRSGGGGFTGPVFSSDGKKAIWAELIEGNILTNTFGVWRLYSADFAIGADGTPSLSNKQDITPGGAKWIEPGNLSPDNKNLLVSADIGISNALGQDQWSLDLTTGSLKNLTNSATVWDEHGFYSPSGKKIVFMSAAPYGNDPNASTVWGLKTEFMLMNPGGTRLQQLTHFNTYGYPEFQWWHVTAAVAYWVGDGSQLFASLIGVNFTNSNWMITFQGLCGTS